MKIIRFPQALIDLIETGDYLAEDDPQVADRFFDAFESTLELIRKTPKIGSVRRSRDGKEIRMWFVRGFEKCLIFYTVGAEEFLILRVVHAARDYTRFLDQD